MFQSVLHFPVWQGAGAPHGYARGAGVLRRIAVRYRPVADVPVDQAAFSEAVDGVKAVATLDALFAAAAPVLAPLPAPVLTLGGDCVADFMPLARALERYGDKVAVLWVDAHPDINTPATSPSGNFHGMLLRALMGEGPEVFTRRAPVKLKARQLFYVGLRDADMDPEEFRIIADKNIFRLSVEDLEAHRWQRLQAALAAGGFSHIYMHVDSDVLSLTDYPQAVVAVPGGVSVGSLVAFMHAMRALYPLAGGALTEFSLGEDVREVDEALGQRLLIDGFGIG